MGHPYSDFVRKMGPLLSWHWDMDAFFVGGLTGEVVAGVGVAGYADAGIIVEHALNAAGGVGGAVGHRHLARVEREAQQNPAFWNALAGSAVVSGL